MAVNATIYLAQITAGNPIFGVFSFWNAMLGGYFLFLLFMAYRIVLQIKTKNSLTGWISTTLFLALYISMYYNTEFFSHTGLGIIFFVLVFEMGASLYNMFVK